MRWLVCIIVGTSLSAAALAGDWPQWLGPNRDGTSTEIIKPWKGDPTVVWRTDVGEGHSSPIVAKGLVYLYDKVPGKETERLSAWTADKGELLGATYTDRPPYSNQFGGGPRATPAFADNVVYAYGVTGKFSSQKLLRSGPNVNIVPGFLVDVLRDFQAPNLKFGVSASPLVEGDLVLVAAGGKGAGVVAFERATGKVAWKALDDPPSYASPIAFGEGKNRQVVFLTQSELVSLSPKDGTVFWRFPFKDALSESSTTPVKIGDLLIASSVTLGSVALKLEEKDGKPAVTQVWKKPELSCYFSTPVAVGKDHVYMINGVLALKPSITLRCVETATGKVLWQKPNIGKWHAALLRTGDDKLLLLDDSGHVTLIQPDPKEYRELARSKVCGETWAHPALTNGRFYIRDNKELICLQLGE